MFILKNIDMVYSYKNEEEETAEKQIITDYITYNTAVIFLKFLLENGCLKQYSTAGKIIKYC